LKLNTIERLYTPDDIKEYVLNLWKTEEFKRSQKEGGFIAEVVERFSTMPAFFFRASDEFLEKAHFSTWWRGMQRREYENPYIHDLYELHEIFHAGDMIYSNDLSFESFKRKMQDNELGASVCSEIEIYLRLEGLRKKSFHHPIFADRFLNNSEMQERWKEEPDRLVKELRLYRQNIMMSDIKPDHPDRPVFWIKQFSYQNETWASTWVHNFRKVENAMIEMRSLVRKGARQDALDGHINWLTSPEIALGGTIPFPDEARAFAESYRLNKQAYARDLDITHPKPPEFFPKAPQLICS
jgi:hypothetical protein